MVFKKTILRIPEGRIELTDRLLTNLRQIIGSFEIENYSPLADIARSDQRRIDSLAKAFSFILDTIPLEKKADLAGLKALLQHSRDQVKFTADLNIDDCQNILSKFTAQLITALIDNYDWSRAPAGIIKDVYATELLNKAEQYVIMVEGRADLATLIRIDPPSESSSHDFIDETELVLLWDQQLPPFAAETLIELECIKAHSFLPPSWFRNLPAYEQRYFHSTLNLSTDITKLKIDLNELSLKWLLLNKQSPINLTLQQSLQALAKNEAPLPGWFSELKIEHRQIILALVEPNIRLHQFNLRLTKLSDSLTKIAQENASSFSQELQKLRALPYWYLLMSEDEQRFLLTCLHKGAKIEEVTSFLSSRLRTIPGMANFAKHQVLQLNQDGELKKAFPKRLRSSHIASRDILGQPDEISELHIRRNLSHLFSYSKDLALLIQTLISPNRAAAYFGTPDSALYDRLNAILKTIHYINLLFYPNHPFNIARFLHPTATNDLQCNALLDYANAHQILMKLPLLPGTWELSDIKALLDNSFVAAIGNAEPSPELKTKTDNEVLGIQKELSELLQTNLITLERWPGWQQAFSKHLYLMNRRNENKSEFYDYQNDLTDLQELADQYKNLLGSGYGTGSFLDSCGRELYLSSLEDLLIIKCDGVSYGSCVSGKDRKAIELCHTDAMLIYRTRYNSWPNFKDTATDRKRFVDLVIELYVSRHSHEHAGQNAPGADGIKTPANYWPRDISDAIRLRLSPNLPLDENHAHYDDPLRIDDILATNNEVRHITGVRAQLQIDTSKYTIAAQRLDRDNRIYFLDLLKSIVNNPFWEGHKQTRFNFYGNFYGSLTPEGIFSLKTILSTWPEGDSRTILAQIYRKISERPKFDPLRSEDTKKLYNCILQLYQAVDSASILDEISVTLEPFIPQSEPCSSSSMTL